MPSYDAQKNKKEQDSLLNKEFLAGGAFIGGGLVDIYGQVNAGYAKADALRESARNDILTVARIKEMTALNLRNLDEDLRQSKSIEATSAATRGTVISDAILLSMAYEAIEEKNLLKLQSEYEQQAYLSSAKSKLIEAESAEESSWVGALGTALEVGFKIATA